MNKKIIDYDVLVGQTVGDCSLVDAVKNRMKSGWEPIGGASEYKGWFVQAMVKYEEE